MTRVKAVDGDFGSIESDQSRFLTISHCHVIFLGFEGQVTYFLQRSTDFRSFIIDSSTGIITTTASLDREERPAYTLSGNDSSFACCRKSTKYCFEKSCFVKLSAVGLSCLLNGEIHPLMRFP